MSWTQVGACPKCGAPIYVPGFYHSVLPPPPQHTCGCWTQPSMTVNATTITLTNDGKDPRNDQKVRREQH